MSSHTNGVVPSRFCNIRRLLEENEELRWKLEREKKSHTGTLAELRNVFLSVKENGYVILHDEESDEKIRLVKEKAHA